MDEIGSVLNKIGGGRGMGLMSEREDEGEVDEKLPSPAKGLAGMTARSWVGDWKVVKSG